MLSQKEKKFRTKIIQEFHYKKSDQRFLDAKVKHLKTTYKAMYITIKKGIHSLYTATATMQQAANSFEKAGLTAKAMCEALNLFRAEKRKFDDVILLCGTEEVKAYLEELDLCEVRLVAGMDPETIIMTERPEPIHLTFELDFTTTKEGEKEC